MSASAFRRLHTTPSGTVESRAFKMERDTFRAEIQRTGDPLTASQGMLHKTLEDAWRWSERSVQTYYPHDCDLMQCGPIREAAG